MDLKTVLEFSNFEKSRFDLDLRCCKMQPDPNVRFPRNAV